MTPKIDLFEKIKEFPDAPGIYLFYNPEKDLIYVGKATSLRHRVQSYFRGQRTPRPIEEMIHEVEDIKYTQTDSVLEAVILEAIYIKKYQPKYNVLGKDDKSWNYIVITSDEFPKIKTIREHDLIVIASPANAGRSNLMANKKRLLRRPPRTPRNDNFLRVFGPYPGLNTREILKILRKLFLYSTCEPNQKRPCLYYQMGQCLGVCTGEITAKDYKERVIKPLVMFLQGRKKQLLKKIAADMKKASAEENFEEAARLRNQLNSLQRIQDVTLLNKSFFEDAAAHAAKAEFRIEGYDISNLGATDKVGSMVVFDQVGPEKSEYRKFNIKTVAGQSDVDCLAEILQRRFNRDDWKLPNVILIDGGVPQVNKAKEIIDQFQLNIPIVGIAKGPERKKNEFILGTKTLEFSNWVLKNQMLLIRVRDEAHRFAITFNRSKRKIH